MKIKVNKRTSGFISKYDGSHKVKHEKKEKHEKENTIEVNTLRFGLDKIISEMIAEGYSLENFDLMFKRINKRDSDITDVDLVFFSVEEDKD